MRRLIDALWTNRSNSERLRIVLLVCWQLAIVLWAVAYPLAIEHKMPHSLCDYHKEHTTAHNVTHKAGYVCFPPMAQYGLGLGAQLFTLPVYASFWHWSSCLGLRVNPDAAWSNIMIAVSGQLVWLGAFLAMFIVMLVEQVGPTAVFAVTTTLAVLMLLTSGLSIAEYALRDCLMTAMQDDDMDWRQMAIAFVDDPPLAHRVNQSLRQADRRGADTLGMPF